MHLKFLAHGTGNPYRAVSYLLATHDHSGQRRAQVKVLRGNPALVAEVAAGLDAVHRYTSGVIGWAREDEPTAEEIDAVLDDFERVAFAGLDANQYSWCVVQHRDGDGSTHVHILAARAELHSGKAMNIAPPGWQKTFDHLRDYWNHHKGWARPDDPLRARPLQPGRSRLASSAAMRKNAALIEEAKALGIHPADIEDAMAVEPDPKREITDWLTEQILAGAINSREDLLDTLATLGTLNRVGADYVSVRLIGHERPLRLKGLLFGADLDVEAIRSRLTGARDLVLSRGEPNPHAADLARRNLEAAIARRAAYNKQRFPVPVPPVQADAANGDATASKVILIEEGQHVRTRDSIAQRLAQAVRAAGKAVRRLVKSCAEAVDAGQGLGIAGRFAERAGASAEHAGQSAERASGATDCAVERTSRSIEQRALKRRIRP